MRSFQFYINKLKLLYIWLIGGLIAISLIYTNALYIVIVLGAIGGITNWLLTGRILKSTPINLSIFVIFFTVMITLWVTADPKITIVQVSRLVAGILFYFSIVHWLTDQKRLRASVVVCMLILLGLSVYAPISVDWVSNKVPFIPQTLYQYFNTFVSDTVHRNVMAGTLGVFLPIPFAFLIFSWKSLGNWDRLLYFTSAGIGSIIFILTQSRGGYIALISVSFIFLILRLARGWVFVLLICFAGILGIYTWGIDNFIAWLTPGISTGGLEGRVEIWSRAIYMIQAFPFTGVGMGLFGKVMDLFYPSFLLAPGVIEHAHNLYLQIAVDLGIPGLLAWLSIQLTVLAAAWKIFRIGKKHQKFWYQGLGIGLLGGLIEMLVHGLFDSVTWGMVKTAPLFWGLMGIVIGAYLIVKSDDIDGVDSISNVKCQSE